MTNTLLLTLSMLAATPETPQASAVRWAIRQVESGDNHRAVGPCGERGAYQVKRVIWEYYECAPFTQATHSWISGEVCKRILVDRMRRHHCEVVTPPFLYALWHRPSSLQKHSYQIAALTRREQDRCRRFANLYAERLKELTR